MSRWLVCIICAALILAGCGEDHRLSEPAGFSHQETPRKFVDEEGNALEEFDFILARIAVWFPVSAPVRVRVLQVDTPGNCHFDPFTQPKSIFISKRWFEEPDPQMLFAAIAHETTHLALYNLTSAFFATGASIYNQFRFLDEGVANLGGREIGGFGLPDFSMVKEVNDAGGTALDLVKNWLNEPPFIDAPGVFNPDLGSYSRFKYAYDVGSSFILYLKSLGGWPRVRLFLRHLGFSKNLDQSLQAVYLLNEPGAERAWHSFIPQLTIGSSGESAWLRDLFE